MNTSPWLGATLPKLQDMNILIHSIHVHKYKVHVHCMLGYMLYNVKQELMKWRGLRTKVPQAYQLHHHVGDLLQQHHQPGGLPVVLGIGPHQAHTVEEGMHLLGQVFEVALFHLLNVSSEGLEVYADVPGFILGLHNTHDHGLVSREVTAH